MKSRNETEPFFIPGSTSSIASCVSHSFLQICYRYRWIILGSTLLSMAGAAGWSLSQAPIYQASAHLSFEIQNQAHALNEHSAILGSDLTGTSLETHLLQLKSHQHFQDTAYQIAASNSPGYQSFVSSREGPSPSQVPWRKSLRTHVRELETILSKWLSFRPSRITKPNAQNSPRELSQNSPEQRLAAWLKEHVGITRAIHASSVKIITHAETPAFAAEIVNTVAAVYVKKIRPVAPNSQTYSSWENSQRIESELRETNNVLKQAKHTLQTFQSKYPHINKENKSQEDTTTSSQLIRLEENFAKATNQSTQYKAHYQRLTKIRENLASHNSDQWVPLSTFQGLPNTLDLPKIQRIYTKRQEWLTKIKGWLEENPSNQVKVKTGHRQIAGLHLLLKKEVEQAFQLMPTQLEKTRLKEQQARQTMTRLKKSQETKLAINAEFEHLIEEVNKQESRYTTLLKEIGPKPVSAIQGSETVRLTRPAIPLYSPISPHPIQATVWGFFMGLGLGVGMAICLNLLPRKINSNTRFIQKPADLNAIKPGLQFLGWMPDSNSSGKGSLPPFLTDSNDSDLANEQMKQITNKILRSSSHEGPQEWLITSPGNHEGKTLLAQNLAKILIQQAAHPVLLIDANISQPTIHNMVPLHKTSKRPQGLSDFLFNMVEIKNIIQKTEIPNLLVISTGKWSTLPPELFQSNRFRQLLQWCKETYIHVIIIGPPVLSAIDTPLIASQVAKTIMIVRPMATSHEEIKVAIHQLETYEAYISGIVYYQLVSEESLLKMENTLPQTAQSIPRSRWKRNNGLPPINDQANGHQPHTQPEPEPEGQEPSRPMLILEKSNEPQPSGHQPSTHQEPDQGRREPSQPTLPDYERENSLLKTRLQHLENEREILVNSVRFFEKLSKASNGIPSLKGRYRLPNKPISKRDHEKIRSA